MILAGNPKHITTTAGDVERATEDEEQIRKTVQVFATEVGNGFACGQMHETSLDTATDGS